MDNAEYINRLESALTTENYSPEFIKKCSHYAYVLLKKDLPVIFDENHLNAILNISDGFFKS